MPGILGRLTLVLLLTQVVSAAHAAPRILDLPLYEPERGQSALPAYHPTKFIVRVTADGPRPGLVAGRMSAAPLSTHSTGLAHFDLLNARYGVTAIEPMFPGESVPEEGSALEDLTTYYVVHLPPGASLAEALGDYADDPEIVSAEPVGIFPVSYTPNDPGRVNQWQLGQANDRDSDVYEAWDTFRGDSSVVIAIVDTGVLWTHPDLGGPSPYTGGNIWTNYTELGGTPGVDDDGNGLVDDFRGWDYVNGVSAAPGEDATIADNDPKDFNGHGTFCSGMASAITDNATGIAGTAFKSKIMALRTGWSAPGGNGQVDISWCAQAINYAANKGARVINCSWSNNNLSGLGSAVANAIAKGVSICDAAGNDNTSSQASNYLSTRGDCIDVASVNISDVRSTFSNYGAWIDAAAAGENVYSTTSASYVATYGTGSGTSFSSPFVAGAVALFQAYRKSQLLPYYTPARMLLRVRDTGDDIDALNGGFAGLIGTRLNVNRLLTDPPTSWVNVTGGAITGAPAVVNFDGDGNDDVVIGTSDFRLLAVTGADGDTLAGWPVNLGAAITGSPAVWDVDLDGLPEVIAGTNGGQLWAVNGDGSSVPGWPVAVTGSIQGSPAVADIAPAAGIEVAVATADSLVYVIDHTGAILPGWPQHTHGPVYSSPALHDFDGDGYAEIVVATYDSTIHVFENDGSNYPGWPVSVTGGMTSSPAVGDIDGDNQADIVVGGNDAKVYGFHADGTPLSGWPVTVAGSVRSSPALADLWGNDGQPEVAVGSDGPTLYVIRGNGTFAPGWPQGLGGNVSGGVVVGNMDADPGLEVACGATDKGLYLFDADGTPKTGWPRIYEGAINGTPTLADPDHDGRAELLFGNDSRRLRAVDLGPNTFAAGAMPWPTFHGDYLRRGSVSLTTVGVVSPPIDGRTRHLAFAASPNPSRGVIRFGLTRGATSSAGDASVRLYDVRGRLVREIATAPGDARDAFVVWDGLLASGLRAPAGLYFAQAAWGGEVARARVVLLP